MQILGLIGYVLRCCGSICLAVKLFLGVGGFPKILRNLDSGSWQMLTFDYKGGGWGEKRPKPFLRNI